MIIQESHGKRSTNVNTVGTLVCSPSDACINVPEPPRGGTFQPTTAIPTANPTTPFPTTSPITKRPTSAFSYTNATFNCNGYNTCASASITCPAYAHCDVSCIGVASCSSVK